MDIKEAIIARHSVRQFKEEAIPENIRCKLETLVDECNSEGDLDIQIIFDDPECFQSLLASYGKFKNVKNYIALIGKKTDQLDETVGYYGQKLVLEAQCLGLNTCWVGGTYRKGKCKASIKTGERLVCVIALGYGVTQGVKHKTRPMEKLSSVPENEMPVWFRNGMKAAMLAPTAINQQKFFVELIGDEAVITAKTGPFSKVDLGIVKYNFEAASGHVVLSGRGR